MVTPSPPRSGKSRRLYGGREEVILGRAVFALVWAISNLIAKVAPYPPRSRGQFSWSRLIHLGPESPGVSILVLKIAPSPLWSGK